MRGGVRAARRGWVLDILTLDRTLGLQATQLIYWGGLAIVLLVAFAVVGAAVGVVIRAGLPDGLLLGVPLLVAGLAVAGVLGLLWRGFCEFYVAVFQIADDLRSMRRMGEAQGVDPTRL